MSANVGSTDSSDQTSRVPSICGCGGLAWNRFCQGHDATLYSELIRHIKVGTLGAVGSFSFVHKNDDEATIDDQREAITDFFDELDATAAD